MYGAVVSVVPGGWEVFGDHVILLTIYGNHVGQKKEKKHLPRLQHNSTIAETG